jgi:hypothetical protein
MCEYKPEKSVESDGKNYYGVRVCSDVRDNIKIEELQDIEISYNKKRNLSFDPKMASNNVLVMGHISSPYIVKNLRKKKTKENEKYDIEVYTFVLEPTDRRANSSFIRCRRRESKSSNTYSKLRLELKGTSKCIPSGLDNYPDTIPEAISNYKASSSRDHTGPRQITPINDKKLLENLSCLNSEQIMHHLL